MENIVSPNPEEESTKASRVKTILGQIFSKNDTLRQELSDFFEDLEIPVRNDQIQMILGVVRMMSFSADKIKISSANMVALREDCSSRQAVETICNSGHSRIPIYREEEGQRNYTGLLYSKDLLRSFHKKVKKFKVSDYMREVQVIPETQSLLSLMRDMRLNRQHLMLVAGEYGEITGLITLEDILEEIVGEIKDEHDSRAILIQEIGHRLYEIDASMNLTDINKELAINLPEEDFNTLAGFLLHEFKGTVEPGQKLEYGDITITITECTDLQILKAHVYIPPAKI